MSGEEAWSPDMLASELAGPVNRDQRLAHGGGTHHLEGAGSHDEEGDDGRTRFDEHLSPRGRAHAAVRADPVDLGGGQGREDVLASRLDRRREFRCGVGHERPPIYLSQWRVVRCVMSLLDVQQETHPSIGQFSNEDLTGGARPTASTGSS